MEFKIDFCNRTGFVLKHLRMKSKLTQIQVAHKLNVDKSYISQIENGRKNISLRSVSDYLMAINITDVEYSWQYFCFFTKKNTE